jgi:hypothetical protein
MQHRLGEPRVCSASEPWPLKLRSSRHAPRTTRYVCPAFLCALPVVAAPHCSDRADPRGVAFLVGGLPQKSSVAPPYIPRNLASLRPLKPKASLLPRNPGECAMPRMPRNAQSHLCCAPTAVAAFASTSASALSCPTARLRRHRRRRRRHFRHSQTPERLLTLDCGAAPVQVARGRAIWCCGSRSPPWCSPAGAYTRSHERCLWDRGARRGCVARFNGVFRVFRVFFCVRHGSS